MLTSTLPLQAGGASILYGLALLVHIGIIIWTYNDASANSDRSEERRVGKECRL